MSVELAVMTLHRILPKEKGDIIGPYCSECVSPIDGGPELWPCLTAKVVLDSICGHVTAL